MSQTGFVLKNQTETRRFEPVSVCFLKKSVWLVTNLKAPPILPVFFTPVYYFSIQPFLQKMLFGANFILKWLNCGKKKFDD